jgi:PEP-CTERM motif-containing protein
MRRLVLLGAVFSFSAVASTAYATSLTFSGSAVGCFNCDSTSLTSSSSVGGLSFDAIAPGSLGVNPDGTVDLGTFTLALSPYQYSSNHTSFLLGVTFTAPAALGGAYTSEVEGTINRQANGAVNIQLDPTFRSFSFSNADGSGSFDFGLFASTLHMQPDNSSALLLGLIRNLQFTPTLIDPVTTDTSGDPVTPVPEPDSVVLFGLGFARLGARRWRQRKQ